MKQVLSFFCVCAYIVGVFGGIGYLAVCDKVYFIAVCVFVVSVMAVPLVSSLLPNIGLKDYYKLFVNWLNNVIYYEED